jgi:hypothetical protein
MGMLLFLPILKGAEMTEIFTIYYASTELSQHLPSKSTVFGEKPRSRKQFSKFS